MVLPEKEILRTLTGLSKNTAETIHRTLRGGNFTGVFDGVPASEAKELLDLAASFAKAQISGFHVGAVAIGRSGRIYVGANLEFQGLPLNATLHAEQSAILNAWMHEEPELTRLYVSAMPCGHCRQFIKELSCADSMHIGIQDQLYSIDELLPHPFGPNRLKGKGLLDSPSARLVSIKPQPSLSFQRAINAAQRSYTPSSRSSEGFLIECLDGKLYAGRAAESTAFNPSVSSILTALNQLNLSASRHVAINACILAKLATATVNPLPMAKAILSSISGASIEVALMEPAS